MVLVFEVLGDTLYKHISSLNFRPMPIDKVKTVTY